MRIISQDNNLDFPYENIAISIGFSGDKKEFYVYAHMINCYEMGKRPQKLAIYSTESKAQKAMEMLREEYGKHLYGQGGAMATANFYVPPFAFIPPKVFQFPKDEDLEVQDEQ